MVSVQVNQLKYKLNQNRKNSQRSSSEYCNLTISKDDIDQLLLGPGHDILPCRKGNMSPMLHNITFQGGKLRP